MGDAKEKERLFQYAVIVNKSDFPYKRYVWASEKQIRTAMDSLNSDEKVLSLGGNLDVVETDISGHQYVSACFNKSKIGSLEIHALNEGLANWAAEVIKLPLPFPNKSGVMYNEDELRIC